MKNSRITDLAAKLAIAGVSGLLCLLVLDRALALLGVPTELPPRFAHPPNMRQVRTTLDFEYEFATNEVGLRYRNIPEMKPAGTHRVLVLGDSYVEGMGVDEGETFSAVLENTFSRRGHEILFINGGLSGTGPMEYARLLFNVGMRYDLDGVLVCIFANDLSNIHPMSTLDQLDPASSPRRPGVRGLAHGILPRTYTLLKKVYLEYRYRQAARPRDFVQTVSDRAAAQGISARAIDQWAARIPPVLVAAVERGEFTPAGLAYGLLRPNYWVDGIDIESDSANVKWELMDGILSEIVSRSQEQGIEVGVTYIPAVYQYDPASHEGRDPSVQAGLIVRQSWLRGEQQIQRRLREWAKAEGVAFLDLTPAFRDAVQGGRGLNWPLDDHWTPAGHQVAGAALASWLSGQPAFSFLAPAEVGTRE